jgi:hypothetical protein
MLLAIDESGSFGATAKGTHFFVALHMRQRDHLLQQKRAQFLAWERTLPRSLKNAKGEFKGAALSDAQLHEFAMCVFGTPPAVGITPVAIESSGQTAEIIRKHRHVALVGIREGVKGFRALGRPAVAQTYEEMGNWFQKLDNGLYLKVVLLGECIVNALINAIGHAVSGDYDDELINLRYLIDRDFVRNPRHLVFWREILRNQLWHITSKKPVPLVTEWRTDGHPFLAKFTRNGKLDLNELFVNHCDFASSHDHPELRMADMTAAIVSRYLNRRECKAGFGIVRRFFLSHGKIEKLELRDFDLEAWRYDAAKNPYT